MVLESDATSAGYVTAMLDAVVKKLIRIEFTNGEAGADERTVIFDIIAHVNVDDTQQETNGMITHEITFESVQEDDHDYFDAVVTNNLSALWA